MSQLQLDPGETVSEGDDLLVSVLASDNELSGVAKVETGEVGLLTASSLSDGDKGSQLEPCWLDMDILRAW